MKKVTLLLMMVLGAITMNAQDLDQWEKRHYVDEFGDPTETYYIGYLTQGEFSNSATSGSDCYFKFTIDDKYFIIDLFEYNKTPVTHYKTTYYNIKVKNQNEEIHEFKGVGYKNINGVILSDSEKENLELFIQNSERFKIVIKENDGRNKYNATINCIGFINH